MIWQQARTLFRSLWLIYMAGFVTLAPVMFIVLSDPSIQARPLTTVLFTFFGLLFGGSIFLFHMKPIYTHLYLFVETIILLWIAFLNPQYTHLVGTLFLPITSQAPLFLPVVQGFLWVFGYIAIAATVTSLSGGPLSEIIALSVLTSGGYLGFGAFGATLHQSEDRRLESQQLLHGLQEAHEQLKQYTEQAEQLAVAEERNRLAREMHDALGHRLTVAVVQLEGAKRLIPSDPDRAADIVDKMRTQLKEALAELRQALSALRMENEAHSEPEELNTAVDKLIHTFQNATGLAVHLQFDPNLPTLPIEYHQALYRALQESLTNIQRHAQASSAWVHICLNNGHIQLTTRDNGQGFSGKIADGRFGLRGLQERAAKLGGQMTFNSVQPTGAELQFIIPLPEPSDEQ